MSHLEARSAARRLAAITLAVGLGLASGTPGRAATGTTVLGFDELESGTYVTDQYATDYGVVLIGPQAWDTTEDKWAARSPRNALVLPMDPDYFCPAGLEMHFREPVGRVKIWVGYRTQLPASGSITLTLYDEDGQAAARAELVANAGEGPSPVSIPLEASAATKIVKAIVTTEQVDTCALAFDDLEFDRFEPPADLQLTPRGWTIVGDSVELDIDVANLGGRPSTATTLTAQAAGWAGQSVEIGPIDPGATSTAHLTMPIPADAFGQTIAFNLQADPKAAGDANDGNNGGQLEVTIPAATAAPPTEGPATAAAGSATPSPPGYEPGPSGDVSPDWVPLAIVVAAAGAVLTAGFKWGPLNGTFKWPWGKPPEGTIEVENDGETATVTLKDGSVRLRAQDADPPKSCQRNTFYLQREVSADLRGKYLDSVSVSFGADRSARTTPLSADGLASLQQAMSAFRRDGDVSVISVAASALADQATGIAGAPPIASLRLLARIKGPSAEMSFTPYHCVVPDGAATGTFKQLGDKPLQKQLQYQATRPLGQVATLDGSARSLGDLLGQLEAGLSALAREL